MWIIPKNLDVSVCVRDTLELNWDLNELSQICERSLMWRGKDSLARTWLQRLKRVNWMQLLSGRILKPSMVGHFITKYTLSLAVIPANPSVVPASEKEQETHDTFGCILKESFSQLDLFGVSSKTSQDTLQLDSLKFIKAYEIWVTKLRQDSLRRRKSVHRIDGNGCLSWLSPSPTERESGSDLIMTKSGSIRKKYKNTTSNLGLSQQVNWPTATSRDWKGARLPETLKAKGRTPTNSLPDMVDGLLDQGGSNTNGKNQGLYPTPSLCGNHNRKGASATSGDGLSTTVKQLQNAKIWKADGIPETTVSMKKDLENTIRCVLNPAWVEQLMGLVTAWTDFDCSETASSPNVRKKHLES